MAKEYNVIDVFPDEYYKLTPEERKKAIAKTIARIICKVESNERRVTVAYCLSISGFHRPAMSFP